MKNLTFPLALLAVLAGTLAQAASPTSAVTPVDMRGLWFLQGEEGAAKCASYLGRRPVEPEAGALVINEKQLQQWAQHSETTMYFVTDVQPRRASTWRLQALVDVPPYEKPKVLETYVFELRQNELLWSRRVENDAQGEQVDTRVFTRCGY